MAPSELRDLVERLKREVPWGASEAAKERLQSLVGDIDASSLRQLLEALVQDDVFRWLRFVLDELSTAFDDSAESCRLIESIIQATRGDLASSFVASTLQSLGQTKRDEALAVAKRLITSGDDVAPFAGFLMGSSHSPQAHAFVGQFASLFAQLSDREKAAHFVALRTLLATSQAALEVQGVKDIVAQGVGDRAGVVHREAIWTLVAFARHDLKAFQKLIIDVASTGSSEKRFYLAGALASLPLDASLAAQALAFCAQDTDPGVLARTAEALYSVAKSQPVPVLRILHEWILRGVDYKTSGANALSDALRESDLKDCLREINSWVTEDANPALLMRIPKLLYEIFAKKPHMLLHAAQSWPRESTTHFRLWTELMAELLTGIHDGDLPDDNLLDSLLDDVRRVAAERGLDVDSITKGERSKLFQAFVILDRLRYPPAQAHFPTLYKTLGWFPVLQDFIGLAWFQRQEKEEDTSHPLLVLLTKAAINGSKLSQAVARIQRASNEGEKAWSLLAIESLAYEFALSCHLNRLLQRFRRTEAGTKHLREGLTNPCQFFQTLSELELLAALKPKHVTVPEPRVDATILDVLATIEGVQVYFETINPEMYKPLKFVTSAINVKNRARGKILEEVKNHFSKVPPDFSHPIIVVMDLSRSEIDVLSIQNALLGTLSLTFYVDKATGKLVETAPTRATDAITDAAPEARLVSAVLAYRRRLGNDLRIRLEGQIFVNPRAANPAPENVLRTLERDFFGGKAASVAPPQGM